MTEGKGGLLGGVMKEREPGREEGVRAWSSGTLEMLRRQSVETAEEISGHDR